MCHLFDKFGKLIKFNDLVDKKGLSHLFFKWMQLIDALPVNWKQAIKSNSNSICNLIVFHFQIIPSILKRIQEYLLLIFPVGLCMTNY